MDGTKVPDEKRYNCCNDSDCHMLKSLIRPVPEIISNVSLNSLLSYAETVIGCGELTTSMLSPSNDEADDMSAVDSLHSP